MSEHQAIIYIIAVIIITLMIWVGFGLFMDAHRASQKDDFLLTMQNIGTSASTFRMKPKSMGGGGGEYIGYTIPPNLTNIDAGKIFAVIAPTKILLVGHSKRGYGTVTAVVNDSGLVGTISFDGDF